MSQDSYNPFAPPADQSYAVESFDPSYEETPSRMTRLGTSILDGIIAMAIVLPIQLATGFLRRAAQQQVTELELIMMTLLGIVVVTVLNGYTLATRGQTLGKMMAKTQVVDFETGKLLPFFRVFMLRNLWLLPLNILVALLPGNIDNVFANVIAVLDVLFIFGAANRCLHDYIAGSKVVVFKPNRERLV